jgi:hypothetical protein
MLVILSPVVLRCSIGALVRSSNVGSSSSGVLKAISFLWVISQTLNSYWDFTNGDAVLLARREIADLVLEKRQKRVRIASGSQMAIVAVRGTKF